MKRNRLTLNPETIRALLVPELHQARGGNSQGGACDNTVGKTQCDLQGCVQGARPNESAQTQGDC